MSQTTYRTPMPVTIWAQTVARWREKNPVYFDLIQKYSFVPAIISALTWWITSSLLPDLHLSIPVWLTAIQSQMDKLTIFLTGLGLGAYGVAGTTIQGASPPLVTGKVEGDSAEDLQQKVNSMEAIIRDMQIRLGQVEGLPPEESNDTNPNT